MWLCLPCLTASRGSVSLTDNCKPAQMADLPPQAFNICAEVACQQGTLQHSGSPPSRSSTNSSADGAKPQMQRQPPCSPRLVRIPGRADYLRGVLSDICAEERSRVASRPGRGEYGPTPIGKGSHGKPRAFFPFPSRSLGSHPGTKVTLDDAASNRPDQMHYPRAPSWPLRIAIAYIPQHEAGTAPRE